MADKPVTREEKYLAYLTGDYTGEIPKPITRKEKYLYELCLKGMGGEISPEEIKNAVNEYLEKNPVKPGAAAEQAQQIERNKTDIGLLKTETNSLKGEIADKATLENGVVKFWKTSTEENRTDTLLYSVDISSIGGTGGLDLENLTLSVSQVGNYQRLSMSDGTTTKNVDIPIITITDEQVSTVVQKYLEENPVSGLDASTAETNQVPVADGNGNWSWQTQQSGTGSEEIDPTVPNWAKQPNKPTYTADEVGALPDTTKIPSKTSDLQNDSGFLTEHQDLSGYALKSEVPKSASDVGADASGTAESKVSEHNVSDTAHNDIRLLVHGLIARLNALADSDDTTLDQMSEVVAYIKSNKSLIDAITTSKANVSDIIDNLTTNVSNKPLSAAQGVKLKALIDAIKVPVNLSELAGDTTHRTVTDAEKTAWNNKSTFSGNYNDLTNKPSLFSGNYNDLSGKPTLITEERVNELINAKLPKSAEEVQY